MHGLRELAESAVLHAGRLLRARRSQWARTEQRSGHDVKLTGDRGAEAVIIEQLRARSELPVFSEEVGLVGAREGDLIWILDPLDGSANYLREVPCCCVSLALCRAGQPILGVIYDFNRDELFSGALGEGARLNERPVTVSAVGVAAQAMLATGFPVALDYADEAALREYVRSAQRFQKVRCLGSAALMLAYVACGRFDAYLERAVRFWDVAAGVALVLAAGGQVSGLDDDTALDRRMDLFASNGLLENVDPEGLRQAPTGGPASGPDHDSDGR